MQGIPGVTTAESSEYGLRCAYCEGIIRCDGHIEHFRRKQDHRELTFVWENLFLACGARDHCGHYKDRRLASPYDPELLLKVDEDEPEDYLYFHSSGEVRPQQALTDEHLARSVETIRVFGLNDTALRGARSKAVSGYLKMKAADFEELASWDDLERDEYLQQEIDATRWDPYATTIKSFLQKTI